MEIETNKIVFQSKDSTTTIRPDGERGELITKAIQNITETGLPSNEDLDIFGDEIVQFFKESKKVAKDEKSRQMVDAARKVVEEVQTAVHERNYDEKIQEISRKLKDETIVTMPISDEDSEVMASSFKEIGPSLMNLGKSIIQDVEFRKLVVSILDVLSGAYMRVREKLDEKPSLMEVLKQDIQDVETPGIPNTRLAFSQSLMDVGRYTNITPEEKEKVMTRAYRSLLKLRSKEDYKLIFENIFKIFDLVIDIWYRMNKTPTLRNIYGNQTVLTDIKILVERSCGRSLDTWLNTLERLAAIKNDKRYIKIRFGLESLIVDRKGKYQTRDLIVQKFGKITHQINELNENYNAVFKDVIMESVQIVIGISKDPVIGRIKDSLNNLIMEIFVDESGKPSVNAVTNSLIRIRDTFFPIIKEKISTISLPIIEFDSKKYFFRISDIRISVTDIIPDQMKVESDINVQIDFAKLKRYGDFRVKLTLEPFNTEVEGLKFYIKKKKGFRYKDYGTVNIYLKDSSIFLEFYIRLKKDKVDHIECDKVSTNLKGLKIKVKDAKHEVLDKMAMSLFMNTIRSRLEKQLNTVIMDKINGTLCDRINNQLKEYHLKKKNIKLKKDVKYLRKLSEEESLHQENMRELEIDSKRKVVEQGSPEIVERRVISPERVVMRDTSPERVVKEKVKVKKEKSTGKYKEKVKREISPERRDVSPIRERKRVVEQESPEIVERRVISPERVVRVVKRDMSPERVKEKVKVKREISPERVSRRDMSPERVKEKVKVTREKSPEKYKEKVKREISPERVVRRDKSPEKVKEKVKVKREISPERKVTTTTTGSPVIMTKEKSPEKDKIKKKVEIEKDNPKDKVKEAKQDIKDFKREKEDELVAFARSKKGEKHEYVKEKEKVEKVEEKEKIKKKGGEVKYEAKKKVVE